MVSHTVPSSMPSKSARSRWQHVVADLVDEPSPGLDPSDPKCEVRLTGRVMPQKQWFFETISNNCDPVKP